MKKKEKANDSLNAQRLGLELIKAIQEEIGIEKINFLIQQGADVNTIDPIGRTPLVLAAKSGCREVVQLLIKAGASIEGESGVTALIDACWLKNKEMMELLLDNGVNVNTKTTKNIQLPKYGGPSDFFSKVVVVEFLDNERDSVITKTNVKDTTALH